MGLREFVLGVVLIVHGIHTEPGDASLEGEMRVVIRNMDNGEGYLTFDEDIRDVRSDSTPQPSDRIRFASLPARADFQRRNRQYWVKREGYNFPDGQYHKTGPNTTLEMCKSECGSGCLSIVMIGDLECRISHLDFNKAERDFPHVLKKIEGKVVEIRPAGILYAKINPDFGIAEDFCVTVDGDLCNHFRGVCRFNQEFPDEKDSEKCGYCHTLDGKKAACSCSHHCSGYDLRKVWSSQSGGGYRNICSPPAEKQKMGFGGGSKMESLSPDDKLNLYQQAPNKPLWPPRPSVPCEAVIEEGFIDAFPSIPIYFAGNNLGNTMPVVSLAYGSPPYMYDFSIDTAVTQTFYFEQNGYAMAQFLFSSSLPSGKIIQDLAPTPPLINFGQSCGARREMEEPNVISPTVVVGYKRVGNDTNGLMGGFRGSDSMAFDGYYHHDFPVFPLINSSAVSAMDFIASGVLGLGFGAESTDSFLQHFAAFADRIDYLKDSGTGGWGPPEHSDPFPPLRPEAPPPSGPLNETRPPVPAPARKWDDNWREGGQRKGCGAPKVMRVGQSGDHTPRELLERLRPGEKFSIYMHKKQASGGCLTIGGFDDRYFNSEFDRPYWVPVTDDPAPFTIKIKDIEWNGASLGVCSGCKGVIRTSHMDIKAHKDHIDKLYTKGLTYDSMCIENKDLVGNLSIKIDDKLTLHLNNEALIQKSQSFNFVSCSPAIKATNNDKLPKDVWWLGMIIMRSYHVLFDGSNRRIAFVRSDPSYYILNRCKSRGKIRNLRKKPIPPPPPQQMQQHRRRHRDRAKTIFNLSMFD